MYWPSGPAVPISSVYLVTFLAVEAGMQPVIGGIVLVVLGNGVGAVPLVAPSIPQGFEQGGKAGWWFRVGKGSSELGAIHRGGELWLCSVYAEIQGLVNRGSFFVVVTANASRIAEFPYFCGTPLRVNR